MQNASIGPSAGQKARPKLRTVDLKMEADREPTMESKMKVSRLASWARSQKDTWTGKTPQLIVSGDGQDESVDYRHRCKIRYGTKAEVAKRKVEMTMTTDEQDRYSKRYDATTAEVQDT